MVPSIPTASRTSFVEVLPILTQEAAKRRLGSAQNTATNRGQRQRSARSELVSQLGLCTPLSPPETAAATGSVPIFLQASADPDYTSSALGFRSASAVAMAALEKS